MVGVMECETRQALSRPGANDHDARDQERRACNVQKVAAVGERLAVKHSLFGTRSRTLKYSEEKLVKTVAHRFENVRQTTLSARQQPRPSCRYVENLIRLAIGERGDAS
jgi:hypothetical protein